MTPKVTLQGSSPNYSNGIMAQGGTTKLNAKLGNKLKHHTYGTSAGYVVRFM